MFEDILGEEFYEGDENPIEFEWHGEPEYEEAKKPRLRPDEGEDDTCCGSDYNWKADLEKYIEEKLKEMNRDVKELNPDKDVKKKRAGFNLDVLSNMRRK